MTAADGSAVYTLAQFARLAGASERAFRDYAARGVAPFAPEGPIEVISFGSGTWRRRVVAKTAVHALLGLEAPAAPPASAEGLRLVQPAP
jgi:hypothetical protein